MGFEPNSTAPIHVAWMCNLTIPFSQSHIAKKDVPVTQYITRAPQYATPQSVYHFHNETNTFIHDEHFNTSENSL